MTLNYLSHIGEDTDRFIAAASGNFARHVPSCPEWDVHQLSLHVWHAFSFWRQVVEKRLRSHEDAVEPQEPTTEGLLDAVRYEAETLVRVCRETPPETPIWTWSANKTVGFVPRRMAHEIAVHRWDCENAVGEAEPIEAEMAWDGAREFIEHFVEWAEDSHEPVAITLARTDGPEETEARSPGTDIASQATVRGSASDLLLFLWGRLPEDALAVEGDAGSVSRLLEAADQS